MNQTAQSWWFIFYKDQLLLEKKEDGIYAIPCGLNIIELYSK